MASLKELIVNGVARIVGKVYSSAGFVGNLEGNATSASKVANSLSFGNKTYDGSSAKTITASDLGYTTYSDMKGATSSEAGTHGLVPAPASGKQTSFLRGDGTWAVPTNGSVSWENVTGKPAYITGSYSNGILNLYTN